MPKAKASIAFILLPWLVHVGPFLGLCMSGRFWEDGVVRAGATPWLDLASRPKPAS